MGSGISAAATVDVYHKHVQNKKPKLASKAQTPIALLEYRKQGQGPRMGNVISAEIGRGLESNNLN